MANIWNAYIAAKCIVSLINARRLDWKPDMATVTRRILAGHFTDAQLYDAHVDPYNFSPVTEGQRIWPIDADEAADLLRQHGITIPEK